MGSSKSKNSISPRKNISKNEYDFIRNLTTLPESKVNELFEEFHKAGDGYLNKDQFVKFYIQLRNEDYDKMKDLAEQIFVSFDSNCDGRLDFKEFLVNQKFKLIL